MVNKYFCQNISRFNIDIEFWSIDEKKIVPIYLIDSLKTEVRDDFNTHGIKKKLGCCFSLKNQKIVMF